LLRLAAADLRGPDAAGTLGLKARLAARSAASRLSSACLVEIAAICAARRSAELGGGLVGFIDTVILFLAAIGRPSGSSRRSARKKAGENTPRG
jgi:hypothetical protein